MIPPVPGDEFDDDVGGDPGAARTGAPESSVCFVDKKVFGKPAMFDGVEKNYTDWEFGFVNWFACLSDDAEKKLIEAAEYPRDISMSAIGTSTRSLSRALYLILSQSCRGRALDLVKGVAEKNGFEAFRRIRKEYAPKSANRVTAMLAKLISEDFKRGDFSSGLTQWENDVREYERVSATTLDERLKVAVVLKGAPTEIQTILQMNGEAQRSYKVLKEIITSYNVARTTWRGDGKVQVPDDPVDVGMVFATFVKHGG